MWKGKRKTDVKGGDINILSQNKGLFIFSYCSEAQEQKVVLLKQRQKGKKTLTAK